MSRGLFITGTNTGVGKTYVGARIVQSLVSAGYKVGVYKPVESGCETRDGKLFPADAAALWEAAGNNHFLAEVCPQCFAAPLAPPLAAQAEGKQVNAALLRQGLSVWTAECDIVIVEGAGGLMSPVSDDDYVADLAAEFGFPLVVVAANELGVVNQTLQTLITAATYCEGLPLAGYVLNQVRATADESMAGNRRQLQHHCQPPLLAEVAYNGELTSGVDWFALAGSAESPPEEE